MLRAFVLFILLLFIAYQAAGPESGLAQAQATATLTTTLTTTGTVRAPFVIFVTPPPVRDEEPLTGASRDVPPVFPGVTDYHPLQAALASEDHAPPPVTSPAGAAAAVVQIRRCNDFGCDTPAGSGVLIHSSGLVLTAYHVLLTDPEDPTSSRYTDFVIALSEDLRAAPQARYRARLAAEKDEQDLALLAIDRDAAGAVVAASQLNLSALPLADITTLFADDLHVLGYPVSGGEGVTYARTSFRSFDDGGRLIVVDPAPDPGASGGPALVQQEGRLAIAGLVIRRRSTQGQLSRQGLLRAIDQLPGLTWTPRAHAWGEDVEAGVQISGTTPLLQLSLRLNTLDMVERPLRLLFYATAAASGQPWPPPDASAPLVVWANVNSQQVIERRSLTLTAPLEDFDALPDQLRFHALLWDTEEGRALWADEEGVEVAPDALALGPSPMPSSIPAPTGAPAATRRATNPPTSTSTRPATATITPVPTQTPDVAATQTGQAAEFATALVATLTAQPTATPTPTGTPDIAQMLATAVAATLTAQPSPTPTATRPPPTSTPTPAVAATPTARVLATPAPTVTPPIPTPDAASDSKVELIGPSESILQGTQTFRWTTSAPLGENQAYELVFWPVGTNPMQTGFGPVGKRANTEVTVNLDAVDDLLPQLIPGEDYEWGVLLVQDEPYARIRYLGASRRFRFERSSSGSSSPNATNTPRS